MAVPKDSNRSADLPLQRRPSSLTISDFRRACKLRRGGIAKLQRTRSTPIVYSDVIEPLTRYKSLSSLHITRPHTFYRYHLTKGICVQDQDTIVHSARDEHSNGHHPAGLLNRSSGTVKYSFDTKERIMLDVSDVLRILMDKPPNSMFRHWRVEQVEKEFRNRWGRAGTWWDNRLQFCTFLSCFHKTLEVFGENNEYVRIRHQWARGTIPRILDSPEKVLVNLARLKIPELIKFQKKMFFNTENIKGALDPSVKDHLFKTDLKLNRILAPAGCFQEEERELYQLG